MRKVNPKVTSEDQGEYLYWYNYRFSTSLWCWSGCCAAIVYNCLSWFQVHWRRHGSHIQKPCCRHAKKHAFHLNIVTSHNASPYQSYKSIGLPKLGYWNNLPHNPSPHSLSATKLQDFAASSQHCIRPHIKLSIELNNFLIWKFLSSSEPSIRSYWVLRSNTVLQGFCNHSVIKTTNLLLQCTLHEVLPTKMFWTSRCYEHFVW